MAEKPIPKTFYEWLMILKDHRLKAGPLEAFQDERFQHAVKPGTIGNVSFGMWDHKTNTGYINWDRVEAPPSPVPVNVLSAPPIPDGDKEWDM
jgi:hypothetical protein